MIGAPGGDEPARPRVLMLVWTSVSTDTRVLREARRWWARLGRARRGARRASGLRAADRDHGEQRGRAARGADAWSRPQPPGAGRALVAAARARPTPARRWQQEALVEGRGHRADVVHAHDFSALPVGAELARDWGVPLVYDSHEVWAGRPRPAVRPRCAPGARHGSSVRWAPALRWFSRSAREWLGCFVNATPGRTCVWCATPSRSDRRREASGCPAAGCGVRRPPRALPRAGGDRPGESDGPAAVHARRTGRRPVPAHLRPRARHPRRAAAPTRSTTCWPEGLALVTHSDRWVNHRLALPNKLFHAVRAGVPVVATDVGELARWSASTTSARCINRGTLKGWCAP